MPATGIGQIPALYGQGYMNAAGQQSVVITDKSAVQHAVTVQVKRDRGCRDVPGGIHPTGTDSSTVNTSTTAMPVTILSTTASNPVPVTPYSVTRVDLNVGGITVQTNPEGLSFSIDARRL